MNRHNLHRFNYQQNLERRKMATIIDPMGLPAGNNQPNQMQAIAPFYLNTVTLLLQRGPTYEWH